MSRSGYQRRVGSLSPTYWLRFDENTTPSDYGSSSLSVSVTGTPSYNQSSSFGTQTDKSVLLDGTNGFSSTANTSIFNDKVFTIECWFKIANADVLSSNYHTFFVANGSAGQALGFRMKGAAESSVKGTIQMYYLAGSGYTDKFLTTTTNYADGNWHHTALTFSSTTATMYVDGSQTGSVAINNSFPSTLSLDGTGNKAIGYLASEGVKGSLNEFAIYNSTLTSTELSDNYAARNWGNYDAEAMTVSTSTFVMPVISAGTGKIIAADPMLTASPHATFIMPSISLGINIDGGGVSTASADIVNPTIYVEKELIYSASPATADSTSPNATVTTTKFVNYSASPATASALLSSNYFGGNTEQDNVYELNIRRISGSISNTGPGGGLMLDSNWDSSGNWSTNKHIAIKAVSGVPANNKIVKARFDPSAIYMSQTTNGVGRIEVRVFTGAPKNGKTFDNMLAADLPDSELLHITRPNDESANSLTSFENLDLTTAFRDSRAATYGIYLVSHEYPDMSTTKPTNRYSTTDWNAEHPSQIQHQLMYFLESDIISKNVNADPMTATGLATDVTVSAQKYVDYLHTVATASADIVNATVALGITANASPFIASAEAIQPTFNRTVEFPHTYAEAFATTVTPTLFIEGSNTYAAAPATASALFHMPQFNIGENNSADNMNASALFVMPTVIIPRVVEAMTTTASTLFVNPTVNSQLLGVVLAQPMTSNAFAPNPPAYLNLFADKWYSTLYAQHSVRHGLASGLGGAFLKIFEDQTTDITQSTPFTVQSQNFFNGLPTLRDLRNNLTYGIVTNSGPENDFNYPVARAVTDYSTAANESRMSVGYFDPYGRKAVRLQNIAFRVKNDYGYATPDFSMEFSIKTTKANQILSYGEWASATGPGNGRTTFNLVDGKLNYFSYAGSTLLHPNSTKPTSGYVSLGEVTGNKAINDNEWHHVIIQYVGGPEMDDGIVGRFQIWIDGVLDIQRFNQGTVYAPDYIGANIENINFAPDLYTSAWSVDAPAIVQERNISLHYFAYIKYDPILAEPMTASVTHTNQNTGKGNRPRALMLYWWPTTNGQNQNFITRRFDTTNAGQGEFDISMAPQELETIDYIKNPPQQYFGWDVFPVDINGYFVSDLVKEEAYGGAQNIQLQDLGGAVLAPNESARPQFKANRRGYFRNTLDDTRRYIDLVKDIDLSQFDMIFFKNYPDQSNEVDSFAKNEIVDPYFNIRETKIFEDFIKSLREAVDTGISLMVNNPQLALDLKIVDRIEPVPHLEDTGYYYSDVYTPTIVPFSASGLEVGGVGTSAQWYDTFKNNRIRVLNTFTDITDWKCNIHVRSAFYNNDDTLNFGGPSRQFEGYEYKPNGLSVGDEFYISTHYYGRTNNYLATPIANVKAGTPITAFANQYRQGLNLVNNPYKDYVTSIAIKPGDVLDGRQVKGKIWVNFTDPINKEIETAYMDAIHTQWINLAYAEEAITLAERDAYLASPNLLENKLASGAITQSVYNREILWQMNGMNILSQAQEIEMADSPSDFTGTRQRKGTTRKTNSAGKTSAVTTSFGGQWFAFTYARTFAQLSFEVLSMNTRGLRWLSDRVAAVEQNQAHTAMPASGVLVQPTITVQKELVTNVEPMFANATKIPAVGYAGNDINNLSLPLQAFAAMTQIAKLISAAPMTAAAVHRDSQTRTTALDQVIVYVLHEDPILYLREDIIK